jgi:hypothetical protein
MAVAVEAEILGAVIGIAPDGLFYVESIKRKPPPVSPNFGACLTTLARGSGSATGQNSGTAQNMFKLPDRFAVRRMAPVSNSPQATRLRMKN